MGIDATGFPTYITHAARHKDDGADELDARLDKATGVIPIGGIISWAGAIADIPAGWAICDGANGTPDLTDSFILHADADSGGTNDVGDTGGVSSHALSVGEAPAHTHPVRETLTGAGAIVALNASSTISTAATYDAPEIEESVGGGGAHTNRDKYHSLAYIMRTA